MGARGVPLGVYRALGHPSSVVRSHGMPRTTDDYILAPHAPRSHPQLLHHSPHRQSEEHTSELQSQSNLVCRLLLEKKKKTQQEDHIAKSVATRDKLCGHTN